MNVVEPLPRKKFLSRPVSKVTYAIVAFIAGLLLMSLAQRLDIWTDPPCDFMRKDGRCQELDGGYACTYVDQGSTWRVHCTPPMKVPDSQLKSRRNGDTTPLEGSRP